MRGSLLGWEPGCLQPPRRSHDIIVTSHIRFSVLNPYNLTVLFKSLFMLTSKKTPKLHIARTLWGNSTVYHHSAITFNIMSHKISWDIYFVSVLHTNKQHQLCTNASYCATSVEANHSHAQYFHNTNPQQFNTDTQVQFVKLLYMDMIKKKSMCIQTTDTVHLQDGPD